MTEKELYEKVGKCIPTFYGDPVILAAAEGIYPIRRNKYGVFAFFFGDVPGWGTATDLRAFADELDRKNGVVAVNEACAGAPSSSPPSAAVGPARGDDLLSIADEEEWFQVSLDGTLKLRVGPAGKTICKLLSAEQLRDLADELDRRNNAAVEMGA